MIKTCKSDLTIIQHYSTFKRYLNKNDLVPKFWTELKKFLNIFIQSNNLLKLSKERERKKKCDKRSRKHKESICHSKTFNIQQVKSLKKRDNIHYYTLKLNYIDHVKMAKSIKKRDSNSLLYTLIFNYIDPVEMVKSFWTLNDLLVALGVTKLS